WVPPSIHWRQPYWEHWQTFVDYVSRLSAVMSQGTHVADVALLYPLTTVHANWLRGDSFTSAADECAMTTFALARQIYEAGIDFDFVDDNLLSQAVVRDGTLEIAGIQFRAVLLPPMTTIRRQTLAKLREFYDGGGTVVAFRRLPGASQEHGRGDPEVRALLQHIFGIASSEEAAHRTEAHSQALGSIYRQGNEHGGQGIFLPSQETARTPHAAQRGVDVAAVISGAIDRDVVASERNVFHTHQRIGELDVYFLYNVESERRELTFTLRVRGEPEIWDCWSGEVLPWHRFACTDDRTTVRLTMEANQGIVLVLRPPEERPAVTVDTLGAIAHVETVGDTVEVRGTVEDGGAKSVRVRHKRREYGAKARFGPAPGPLHLTGDWSFRLTPTMDNRWGDFREPAGDEYIGAEARQFRYREEEETPGVALDWHSRDFDDGSWPVVTYTFGPYWRASGPFPRGHAPPELAALIAGDTDTLDAGGMNWEAVCFSQEFGQPGTDVFGGSHGVPDSFLCFDVADEHEERVRYLYTHVRAPRAGRWTLHVGADSGQVEQAWLNGEALLPDSSGEPVPAATEVVLREGLNLLLLACVQPPGQPLRAYAALLEPSTTPVRDRPAARLIWFTEPSKLLYDIAPHKEKRAGWYRCEAPAGTHTLHLDVDAENVQVWVNSAEAALRDGHVRLNAPVADVSQVALRVEQKPGVYAGAAIRQPVRFECADTALPLGDWSRYALENYSGGAVYKKRFSLTNEQLQGEVALDLGAVNTTAEVAVNGQVVGVRLARPYRFDITDQVREGENELEVTVYNTLANYFSTGPYESQYVFPGQTVSGLLGPVTVSFPARVTLAARPVVDSSL
ncbi:MAG: glycosyl hydrolase, partial [Caldilineaceae bacterium]|nr:glycosyl hydrolase [Caldilineaceae bacterium]